MSADSRAPEDDSNLVVGLDKLGVESKYRKWKRLLREDNRVSSRWCMFDGENYDAFGILASYIYNDGFELSERSAAGMDFGLMWCCKGSGMALIPDGKLLSEMMLDRVVDSVEWISASDYFTPDFPSLPIDLTRCGLLQRMTDAGCLLAQLADFMDEAGWGTIIDLVSEARTASDFSPLHEGYSFASS